MPSLVRPQEQRRVVRQRAARRCAARPLFAKIELQSAWDQVQALAQGGEWVGAGLDGGMLERLRARLPSFLNARPTPDRSRLSSVESFFRYTEEEGRRFFEELDRDGDGRVRLDDLRVCMRRRRLPERYAHEFLRRAKRSWFAGDIGWDEFSALMHEREAFTLRAYNSLRLNRKGHLSLPAIATSLRRLGLPATDENASAMLRYLGRAEDGYISYGQFRNFALLLPPEQVKETDPSVLWFEAATFVQLRAPAVAAGATGVALLKAALAGAVASGSTTALMHPLDTLKTRVQASIGRAPGLAQLGRMIPELGARRLYLGILPAVAGAATSHGIRTASYEWARVALAPLLALGLPGVSETAIQGIASGFGTFLGTAVRIPNEVLKQRLQTGQHAHVLAAATHVLRNGGARALFAGTTATLAREVPFYVLGMVAYEQLKKAARALGGGGELTPWQMIMVGALSGAIAAVATTPADVLKTRIMTGNGMGLGAWGLAQRMVKEEGLASLYKGAAPRALWVSPVGAMNFAAYELLKGTLQPPPPPPPEPEPVPPPSPATAAQQRLRDGAREAVAGLRRASVVAAAQAAPSLRRAQEAAATAAAGGARLVRSRIHGDAAAGEPSTELPPQHALEEQEEPEETAEETSAEEDVFRARDESTAEAASALGDAEPAEEAAEPQPPCDEAEADCAPSCDEAQDGFPPEPPSGEPPAPADEAEPPVGKDDAA